MCCFPYHSWRAAMALSWILWSWCVDCIRVCSVLQQKCSVYHSFSKGSLVQWLLLQTCLELKVEPSSTFWLLPSAAAVSHAFQQSDTITKLKVKKSQLHNSASCNESCYVTQLPWLHNCCTNLPALIAVSDLVWTQPKTPCIPHNSCPPSFITC